PRWTAGGGALWLLLSPPRGTPITLLPPSTPLPLRIHVAGAVAHPGIVELAPGARVAQAIEAAGGTLEGANPDGVNLAAALEDGDQVRVPWLSPATGEAAAGPAPGAPETPGAVVNLNTATLAELDRLPGIGPSLAREILAYREAHGAFASVDDLLLVPGIGPAKLAALRDCVRID
ncbi:MAG: ComEA family DNA-binding protein, partial [Chloroflexi bacterium]|nr:ComEA family DNA-binding protein [Chloroflexota bacterium]